MRYERATHVRRTGFLAFSLAALAYSGCADEALVARGSGLVASCSETDDAVPEGAWQCPETRTVECSGGDGTASVDAIYFVPNDGSSCTERALTVSDAGPFTVGTHEVSVLASIADAGTQPLCSSELVVVDTQAPVASVHSLVIWPSNCLMHTIFPDDCVAVEDRCDGILHASFTSAEITSSPPKRRTRYSSSDILFAEDQVRLRAVSEAYGDRIYELGFRSMDATGNAVEGVCTVVVPYDQTSDAEVEAESAVNGCRGWSRAPSGSHSRPNVR